jgi:hypothetical protein
MAAVTTYAFVGLVLWTVVAFLASVTVGRTLRRMEPIPVRTRSQRIADARRTR